MHTIKKNLLDKGHKDLFIVLASISPNAPGDIIALCKHKYSCNVKSVGNRNTTFLISGVKDKAGIIRDLKFLHYHVKEDGHNIKVEISGHGDQSYDWRSKWNAEHSSNSPKNFEPINATLDMDIFKDQIYYRFDEYGPNEDRTVFYATKNEKGSTGVFLVDYIVNPVNNAGLRFMRCRCSENYLKDLVEYNKNCYRVKEADVVNFYKCYRNTVKSSVIIPDDAKPYYKNFMKRTTDHIQRVYNNSLKISENFPELNTDEVIQRGIYHDASKFQDEELVPYIWLTEFYRAKEADDNFEYPEGMKEKADKACDHHVKNNRHHVDFHKQLSDMTKEDLAEMVADWAAMSQELDNSLAEWKDKFVKEHKGFTPSQLTLIDRLVALFE